MASCRARGGRSSGRRHQTSWRPRTPQPCRASFRDSSASACTAKWLGNTFASFLSFDPLVMCQKPAGRPRPGCDPQAGPPHRRSVNAGLIGFMHLISRVVGVAPRIKGVEGAPVVVIEGKAELDPLGQIRIRNEVATERDHAGMAIGDSGRCIGFEAAGSDDRPLKDLTQLLCCDRTLPFGNQISALYSGLD